MKKARIESVSTNNLLMCVLQITHIFTSFLDPPFALKTEFSSPDVKKCLPVKKNADKELDGEC